MENNDFLNQLIQILLPILATFITGVFTYLGNKIKKTYEEKVKTETAKTVVKDVVQFVEQVYKDLHGPEKLQKAIEQASAILKSKGIEITETEINMLIESAVYGLNEGLKKDEEETLKDVKTDTQLLTQEVMEDRTQENIKS